jgi:hypothetical protein
MAAALIAPIVNGQILTATDNPPACRAADGWHECSLTAPSCCRPMLRQKARPL